MHCYPGTSLRGAFAVVGCRYFPANVAIGQINALTHNKLLLMGPSYDRHGTVGFRCVADADPSLHWIPLRG